MALFNPCMKFEKFVGQMPLLEVLRKVSFRDFIQNMSQDSGSVQVLIRLEKVDKWDYLKNPSHKFEKMFLFRVPMNP